MGNMSFVSLILNASLLVKMVMLFLLAFSVLSWSIIFYQTQNLRQAKNEFKNFKKVFYSDINLHDLYAKLSLRQARLQAMESIFVKSYREYLESAHNGIPKEITMSNIERQMRIILTEQENKLENKLGLLASIQSMSPYIGLFGTVWGIMQSFRSLGLANQTSIAAVAPGIAEALIATALGLIVAIPAGLAYNRLLSKASWLSTQYQIFSEQVLGLLEHKLYASK